MFSSMMRLQSSMLEEMYRAAQEGDTERMKVLLGRGATVESHSAQRRFVQQASASGDVELLKMLLQRGVPVHDPAIAIESLHNAAEDGDAEMVALLLEHGARIYINDVIRGVKDTALHLAVRGGHLEVAKILLDHGANIEARTSTRRCSYGDDAFEFFVDGNVKPLHIAAEEGHFELAKELLSRRVNVNTTTEFGYTPLHLAVIENHIDVVRLLLEHRAGVAHLTKEGESVIDIANRRRHGKIMNVIEAHMIIVITDYTYDERERVFIKRHLTKVPKRKMRGRSKPAKQRRVAHVQKKVKTALGTIDEKKAEKDSQKATVPEGAKAQDVRVSPQTEKEKGDGQVTGGLILVDVKRNVENRSNEDEFAQTHKTFSEGVPFSHSSQKEKEVPQGSTQTPDVQDGMALSTLTSTCVSHSEDDEQVPPDSPTSYQSLEERPIFDGSISPSKTDAFQNRPSLDSKNNGDSDHALSGKRVHPGARAREPGKGLRAGGEDERPSPMLYADDRVDECESPNIRQREKTDGEPSDELVGPSSPKRRSETESNARATRTEKGDVEMEAAQGEDRPPSDVNGNYENSSQQQHRVQPQQPLPQTTATPSGGKEKDSSDSSDDDSQFEDALTCLYCAQIHNAPSDTREEGNTIQGAHGTHSCALGHNVQTDIREAENEKQKADGMPRERSYNEDSDGEEYLNNQTLKAAISLVNSKYEYDSVNSSDEESQNEEASPAVRGNQTKYSYKYDINSSESESDNEEALPDMKREQVPSTEKQGETVKRTNQEQSDGLKPVSSSTIHTEGPTDGKRNAENRKDLIDDRHSENSSKDSEDNDEAMSLEWKTQKPKQDLPSSDYKRGVKEHPSDDKGRKAQDDHPSNDYKIGDKGQQSEDKGLKQKQDVPSKDHDIGDKGRHSNKEGRKPQQDVPSKDDKSGDKGRQSEDKALKQKQDVSSKDDKSGDKGRQSEGKALKQKQDVPSQDYETGDKGRHSDKKGRKPQQDVPSKDYETGDMGRQSEDKGPKQKQDVPSKDYDIGDKGRQSDKEERKPQQDVPSKEYETGDKGRQSEDKGLKQKQDVPSKDDKSGDKGRHSEDKGPKQKQDVPSKDYDTGDKGHHSDKEGRKPQQDVPSKDDKSGDKGRFSEDKGTNNSEEEGRKPKQKLSSSDYLSRDKGRHSDKEEPKPQPKEVPSSDCKSGDKGRFSDKEERKQQHDVPSKDQKSDYKGQHSEIGGQEEQQDLTFRDEDSNKENQQPMDTIQQGERTERYEVQPVEDDSFEQDQEDNYLEKSLDDDSDYQKYEQEPLLSDDEQSVESGEESWTIEDIIEYVVRTETEGIEDVSEGDQSEEEFIVCDASGSAVGVEDDSINRENKQDYPKENISMPTFDEENDFDRNIKHSVFPDEKPTEAIPEDESENDSTKVQADATTTDVKSPSDKEKSQDIGIRTIPAGTIKEQEDNNREPKISDVPEEENVLSYYYVPPSRDKLITDPFSKSTVKKDDKGKEHDKQTAEKVNIQHEDVQSVPSEELPSESEITQPASNDKSVLRPNDKVMVEADATVTDVKSPSDKENIEFIDEKYRDIGIRTLPAEKLKEEEDKYREPQIAELPGEENFLSYYYGQPSSDRVIKDPFPKSTDKQDDTGKELDNQTAEEVNIRFEDEKMVPSDELPSKSEITKPASNDESTLRRSNKVKDEKVPVIVTDLDIPVKDTVTPDDQSIQQLTEIKTVKDKKATSPHEPCTSPATTEPSAVPEIPKLTETKDIGGVYLEMVKPEDGKGKLKQREAHTGDDSDSQEEPVYVNGKTVAEAVSYMTSKYDYDSGKDSSDDLPETASSGNIPQLSTFEIPVRRDLASKQDPRHHEISASSDEPTKPTIPPKHDQIEHEFSTPYDQPKKPTKQAREGDVHELHMRPSEVESKGYPVTGDDAQEKAVPRVIGEEPVNKQSSTSKESTQEQQGVKVPASTPMKPKKKKKKKKPDEHVLHMRPSEIESISYPITGDHAQGKHVPHVDGEEPVDKQSSTSKDPTQGKRGDNVQAGDGDPNQGIITPIKPKKKKKKPDEHGLVIRPSEIESRDYPMAGDHAQERTVPNIIGEEPADQQSPTSKDSTLERQGDNVQAGDGDPNQGIITPIKPKKKKKKPDEHGLVIRPSEIESGDYPMAGDHAQERTVPNIIGEEPADQQSPTSKDSTLERLGDNVQAGNGDPNQGIITPIKPKKKKKKPDEHGLVIRPSEIESGDYPMAGDHAQERTVPNVIGEEPADQQSPTSKDSTLERQGDNVQAGDGDPNQGIITPIKPKKKKKKPDEHGLVMRPTEVESGGYPIAGDYAQEKTMPNITGVEPVDQPSSSSKDSTLERQGDKVQAGDGDTNQGIITPVKPKKKKEKPARPKRRSPVSPSAEQQVSPTEADTPGITVKHRELFSRDLSIPAQECIDYEIRPTLEESGNLKDGYKAIVETGETKKVFPYKPTGGLVADADGTPKPAESVKANKKARPARKQPIKPESDEIQKPIGDGMYEDTPKGYTREETKQRPVRLDFNAESSSEPSRDKANKEEVPPTDNDEIAARDQSTESPDKDGIVAKGHVIKSPDIKGTGHFGTQADDPKEASEEYIMDAVADTEQSEIVAKIDQIIMDSLSNVKDKYKPKKGTKKAKTKKSSKVKPDQTSVQEKPESPHNDVTGELDGSKSPMAEAVEHYSTPTRIGTSPDQQPAKDDQNDATTKEPIQTADIALPPTLREKTAGHRRTQESYEPTEIKAPSPAVCLEDAPAADQPEKGGKLERRPAMKKRRKKTKPTETPPSSISSSRQSLIRVTDLDDYMRLNTPTASQEDLLSSGDKSHVSDAGSADNVSDPRSTSPKTKTEDTNQEELLSADDTGKGSDADPTSPTTKTVTITIIGTRPKGSPVTCPENDYVVQSPTQRPEGRRRRSWKVEGKSPPPVDINSEGSPSTKAIPTATGQRNNFGDGSDDQTEETIPQVQQKQPGGTLHIDPVHFDKRGSPPTEERSDITGHDQGYDERNQGNAKPRRPQIQQRPALHIERVTPSQEHQYHPISDSTNEGQRGYTTPYREQPTDEEHIQPENQGQQNSKTPKILKIKRSTPSPASKDPEEPEYIRLAYPDQPGIEVKPYEEESTANSQQQQIPVAPKILQTEKSTLPGREKYEPMETSYHEHPCIDSVNIPRETANGSTLSETQKPDIPNAQQYLDIQKPDISPNVRKSPRWGRSRKEITVTTECVQEELRSKVQTPEKSIADASGPVGSSHLPRDSPGQEIVPTGEATTSEVTEATPTKKKKSKVKKKSKKSKPKVVDGSSEGQPLPVPDVTTEVIIAGQGEDIPDSTGVLSSPSADRDSLNAVEDNAVSPSGIAATSTPEHDQNPPQEQPAHDRSNASSSYRDISHDASSSSPRPTIRILPTQSKRRRLTENESNLRDVDKENLGFMRSKPTPVRTVPAGKDSFNSSASFHGSYDRRSAPLGDESFTGPRESKRSRPMSVPDVYVLVKFDKGSLSNLGVVETPENRSRASSTERVGGSHGVSFQSDPHFLDRSAEDHIGFDISNIPIMTKSMDELDLPRSPQRSRQDQDERLTRSQSGGDLDDPAQGGWGASQRASKPGYREVVMPDTYFTTSPVARANPIYRGQEPVKERPPSGGVQFKGQDTFVYHSKSKTGARNYIQIPRRTLSQGAEPHQKNVFTISPIPQDEPGKVVERPRPHSAHEQGQARGSPQEIHMPVPKPRVSKQKHGKPPPPPIPPRGGVVTPTDHHLAEAIRRFVPARRPRPRTAPEMELDQAAQQQVLPTGGQGPPQRHSTGMQSPPSEQPRHTPQQQQRQRHPRTPPPRGPPGPRTPPYREQLDSVQMVRGPDYYPVVIPSGQKKISDPTALRGKVSKVNLGHGALAPGDEQTDIW